jgi:hypothetical protein
VSGTDADVGSAFGVEVAVKLEQIRGTMETGFATINGRLDVGFTRTAQLESEVLTLRSEIEALKRARWPLPSLAAVTGVGALVVSVLGYAGR